jgi:predicted proteasome-type protease
MLFLIFLPFISFSDGCELNLSIQQAIDKLSVRHESITIEKFLEVTQDQQKHKHYIRKNSSLHSALKR